MSVATEVFALRNSAGLSCQSHVAVVRIDGADALDFLQTASTHSPYVREGRVRHSLFLRDDASVFADVFLVKVDDGFVVLAEGPTEDALATWLAELREKSAAKDVVVRAMHDELVVVGVDGPYAWEVVSGALGPAVLGMPYLSMFRRDDVLCLRAGKTGEYGFSLLVPPARLAEIEAEIDRVGAPLDLARVSMDALDVCALENWHFSMRTAGTPTRFESALTPIELQLQWRVVYSREFAGAEALRARRAAGPTARATCFTAQGAITAGQRVRLGELEVGEVLAACASPTLGITVGSALLDARFAHPHLTLHAIAGSGAQELRTCTASLVDNKSLHVNPHKHAYATRGEVT